MILADLTKLLSYSFVHNALIGAVLTSIACGIVGTIIVEKKMVMLSGGIAHTAFGGIGTAYFMGFSPILGAMIFSVLAVLGISQINKRVRSNPDILIGMFWAVGMAIGIVFISLATGYPPDISSYLFGDILAISKTDLIMMLFNNILIILVVFLYFNALQAYIFDSEFAYVLKINIKFLEYALYILVAITIVMLLKIVGIILVIALLTIPPAIAKLFTHDLKKIMLVASALGMIFCFVGLWISYNIQIPSGSLIILLAGITYVIASCIVWKQKGKMLMKSQKV